MIVCWTVKGGSGVSVTAALLSSSMARAMPTTLVDLQGDQPSILDVEEEGTVGVNHWLSAGSGVLPEALSRLTIPVNEQLSLLPSGTAPIAKSISDPATQAQRLRSAIPNAIVDAGLVQSSNDLGAHLAREADVSLLIIRPCYLAIRRASKIGTRPNGIIVIEEAGRSLDSRDIGDVLHAPVLATLPCDPSVARAVDAGRLLPRKGKVARLVDRLALEILDQRCLEPGVA